MTSPMPTPRRHTLTRARLLHLLEKLKADPTATGSLYVPAGTPPARVMELTKGVTPPLPDEAAEAIVRSPTGVALFVGSQSSHLVIPPFPITEEKSSNTIDIGPLHSLLSRDFLTALVMVRLGMYGIAVMKGQLLLSVKTGTGLVHARHRQGGSSSHRFERHREKQMEAFFTRVCAHAREELEPHARQLDYLIYGGAKETTLDFRKQCDFLRQFDGRTLNRLINLREPRRSEMPEAVEAAWSSRVMEWQVPGT